MSTEDEEVQGEEEGTETFMRTEEGVVGLVRGFCFMSGNGFCRRASCL